MREPRVRFGRRWSISSPCPYPSWNVCDMRMRLRCISSAGIVLLILVCASYSGRDRRVEMATFAGGCFWCMEPPFDKLKGVTATTSGYIGGTKKKPTYAEVSRGLTGHAEAVRVTYDPEKVTYSKLLEVFWHNIDPTTPNRQFCDVGSQYRPAIFYHDETQRRLAEESKQALEQSRRFPKVAVEIAPAGDSYPAEDYHQDYYIRNPQEYHEYRYRCGRDQRLRELWGRTK